MGGRLAVRCCVVEVDLEGVGTALGDLKRDRKLVLVDLLLLFHSDDEVDVVVSDCDRYGAADMDTDLLRLLLLLLALICI
jgi:hypothetical protein